MKVLMLISSLTSGGAERQLVNLSILLRKKGIDIEVAYYTGNDFYKHYLQENHVPFTYIKTSNKYLDRVIKVRRFIRKGNYNVVVSFLEVPDFLNHIAAIGGRTWKIITNELTAQDSNFLSNRGRLFSYFYKYSDYIICNSNNAKKMWEHYCPKYSKKLDVIYNPVLDIELSSSYVPKKNEKLNIIIAASYQYLKNPIGMIKALCLMSERERSNIRINWYGRIDIAKGNTKAYDESIKLIKEYNLDNIIYLNEETKDIINRMNEADIVALFSRVEGLPNAICEAMTIGKPIIMSRVSDYSILVDSSNGFLCDWDSEESIKDAIIAASNISEEKLLEMGKNSKKKAVELFSSEQIIKQWIDIIEK